MVNTFLFIALDSVGQHAPCEEKLCAARDQRVYNLVESGMCEQFIVAWILHLLFTFFWR